MTEQKHTPGPWHWCMGLQHHVTVGEISGTDIPAENLIANVPSGRANARLIAAAPMLLERLQDIIAAHDYNGVLEMNSPEISDDHVGPHPWHIEWLSLTRAAISKATGQ